MTYLEAILRIKQAFPKMYIIGISLEKDGYFFRLSDTNDRDCIPKSCSGYLLNKKTKEIRECYFDMKDGTIKYYD